LQRAASLWSVAVEERKNQRVRLGASTASEKRSGGARWAGGTPNSHSGSLCTVVKRRVWKGVPAAASSFLFCLSEFSSAVLATEAASKSPVAQVLKVSERSEVPRTIIEGCAAASIASAERARELTLPDTISDSLPRPPTLKLVLLLHRLDVDGGGGSRGVQEELALVSSGTALDVVALAGPFARGYIDGVGSRDVRSLGDGGLERVGLACSVGREISSARM